MLDHLNAEAARRPIRVVIIGAGGFVGGAIQKQLDADGIETRAARPQGTGSASGRRVGEVERFAETDRQRSDGVGHCAGEDRADADAESEMAEAVCAAIADVEIAHLVYISSDAVYVDDANPVTERSAHCALDHSRHDACGA